MFILKIFLIFLWLFIIPELIGMLFIYKDQKCNKNIILPFVIGYLFCFALCQLLAIPLILTKSSFILLFFLYIFILLIISVVSIILNRKKFKEFINENICLLKNAPKMLAFFAVLLIGIQLFVALWFTHVDDDDAIYVGTATTTVQTNTLYKFDARTGLEYDYFPKKYALAPFPVYMAIVSKLIHIHPAITAHTIMPVILISLSYLIYALIANELFQKEKKSIFLFLIILSIVNLWGNYSIRNNHTFLLFRIWQGKSILANIIIPATWLFFIKAEKNKFRILDCILLLIVIFAGTLTTTLGIGLPGMTLLCLTFIFSIINKNKSYMIKSVICCLPCFIYGILFLCYNSIFTL